MEKPCPELRAQRDTKDGLPPAKVRLFKYTNAISYVAEMQGEDALRRRYNLADIEKSERDRKRIEVHVERRSSVGNMSPHMQQLNCFRHATLSGPRDTCSQATPPGEPEVKVLIAILATSNPRRRRLRGTKDLAPTSIRPREVARASETTPAQGERRAKL